MWERRRWLYEAVESEARVRRGRARKWTKMEGWATLCWLLRCLLV